MYPSYDPPGARRRRPGGGGVRPSPVFLGFLAAAVLGGVLAWSAGSDTRLARFGVFILVVAGWVVTLCLHEFAHAYAAYRAGDRDVEAAGYLTLNPLKYAHPVLSILLPVLFIAQGGIGLPGGAVYLHRHRFRSRGQQSLAALVGPATNAVCAAVLLVLVRSQSDSGGHLVFWSGLAFLALLQVSATVLNLLPIPGLDGWAVIEPYVSRETAAAADRIKPWGMLGVFVLLQVGGLNRVFFDVVDRLYGLSGASRLLWQIGYQLFRFWQQ